MGVTSAHLQQLGIIDETISEPLGGAHRDIEAMTKVLRGRLIAQVDQLQSVELEVLLDRRYQRLMSYGKPD